MGREHESEVSVCPLHHAAARSSGENFSSVKHRQPVTTSGMSRSEQTGLMGRLRQALRSAWRKLRETQVLQTVSGIAKLDQTRPKKDEQTHGHLHRAASCSSHTSTQSQLWAHGCAPSGSSRLSA